jgi:hypothetical protein
VVKARSMLTLLAKALQQLHGLMREESLMTAAQGLALLVECEDFQTYRVSTQAGTHGMQGYLC